MSNLQTYYHFKLDFQKVDQHTGGKWLMISCIIFLYKKPHCFCEMTYIGSAD